MACAHPLRALTAAVLVVTAAACAGSGGETSETQASAPATEIAGPDATVAVDPADDPIEPVDDASADDAGADDARADGKDVMTRADGVEGEGVLPEGYSSATATVTAADGEVCEVCLWLADTDELRGQGLMGVTDLGDAVGMAFRWDGPVSNRFFMFQTPTPLSIAWFTESGEHVGQADMEPCLVDDSATCDRYEADAPYTMAIEMFGGQLDAIGIGPGSTLELTDVPCL